MKNTGHISSMADYVLRRRKGQWVQVDKQILLWRKARAKREAIALEKARQEEPKLKRDILKTNLFGGDDDVTNNG